MLNIIFTLIAFTTIYACRARESTELKSEQTENIKLVGKSWYFGESEKGGHAVVPFWFMSRLFVLKNGTRPSKTEKQLWYDGGFAQIGLNGEKITESLWDSSLGYDFELIDRKKFVQHGIYFGDEIGGRPLPDPDPIFLYFSLLA